MRTAEGASAGRPRSGEHPGAGTSVPAPAPPPRPRAAGGPLGPGLPGAAGEELVRGVLAIDAGNSKTDVAIVAADGTVLGTARGGGFRPHLTGPAGAVDVLAPLVAHAAAEAGLGTAAGRPLVTHTSACLANADLPVEERVLGEEIAGRGWSRGTVVANDVFALLRSGTDAPRGVAVVCGAGINCAGLLPDGRTVRFPALGTLTGDWGGGGGLALEVMWHATRAEDGRGGPTALAAATAAHFGLPTAGAVAEAVHLGDLPRERLHELAPLLFAVAAQGDRAAVALVERQADEVARMALVALRRLDLLDEPVDVVLGGGVLTGGDRLLLDAVTAHLAAGAPLAVPRVTGTPPVVGAALLGLDHLAAAGLGGGPHSNERLRDGHARRPRGTAV